MASNKNKLIIISNSTKGGAWIRLKEYVRHLQNESYFYKLIIYSTSDLNNDGLEIDINEHFIINTPIVKRNLVEFSIKVYRILRELLRESDKEIIVLSFVTLCGISPSILSAKYKFRFISFYRGAEIKQLVLRRKTTGNLLKPLLKILYKYQISKSDRLIFQSIIGLKEFEQELGSSFSQKAYILPNNCNSSFIKSRIDKIKKEIAPKRIFTISFIGRVDIKVKGVDIFLEIAKNVYRTANSNSINEIKFNIVGNGKDEDYVRKFVSKNKLEKNIIMSGFVENPLEQIYYSDLIIVSSRSDAFPNIILEAFSLKKPVLGTKVDGIVELLGYNELLFDMDDIEKPTKMILKLSSDRMYYKELCKLVNKRSEEYYFNWGDKLDKIILEYT